MSKKFTLLALILSSLFLLASCSSTVEKPADLHEFLITEGVKLTTDMEELAESKEYLSLMTASESIKQVIGTMTSGDYGKPENAYLIKLPANVLFQSIHSLSEDINISDNLMEKLKYKMNGSIIANMINSSYGSEMIAATAMMTWGKSYIQPKGWSDSMVLLLKYPGDFSSLVSFVQSGDNVISASSVFVKNGEKDVWASFNEFLDMKNIEYEQYSNSQMQPFLAK